jgi:DNA-binding beta-propeller fold protein YncE
MNLRRKSLTVVSLVALLCAVWEWRIANIHRQVSTAHAQLVQANDWTTPEAQRLGIRLMDTRDPSGPPAYPVAPGDLLFFTNSGNEYASKNTRNSVVVINARTRKPIVMSDLDSYYTERYGSHGIGLAPDGKYIYLPNIEGNGAPGSRTPNSTLILDGRTLNIYQVIASGGTPHHAKAYRDSAGRPVSGEERGLRVPLKRRGRA